MDNKQMIDLHVQEQALQLMCMADTHPERSIDHLISEFYEQLIISNHQTSSSEHLLPPIKHHNNSEETQQLVKQLVSGARLMLQELDEILKKTSHHWRLERMTWVDRNLLRLAVYELKVYTEIPHRLIIHQAIELAKRFSTEQSPAFINGILDKASSELSK